MANPDAPSEGVSTNEILYHTQDCSSLLDRNDQKAEQNKNKLHDCSVRHQPILGLLLVSKMTRWYNTQTSSESLSLYPTV